MPSPHPVLRRSNIQIYDHPLPTPTEFLVVGHIIENPLGFGYRELVPNTIVSRDIDTIGTMQTFPGCPRYRYTQSDLHLRPDQTAAWGCYPEFVFRVIGVDGSVGELVRYWQRELGGR